MMTKRTWTFLEESPALKGPAASRALHVILKQFHWGPNLTHYSDILIQQKT